MTRFLHFLPSFLANNLVLVNHRIEQFNRRNKFLLSMFFCVVGFSMSAQQVDNWYSADRAINTPSPVGELWRFTPYAPADGTLVNIWYDLVDFDPLYTQNAMEHPNPLNYDQPWENYPNHGFEHPGGPGFLTPTGTIPGVPTLRRDIMNFNPAIEFDDSGAGDALYFRSHARDTVMVLIVFSATGAGNTAETQSLLFGGDIQTHISNITNLSLGVSSGNRFSVGRTWDTGTFFQAGSIDLLGRPTIGGFLRQTVANSDQETLTTRVNGLVDINGLVRNDPTADESLFYYNRMGKHFNDTDPGGIADPSNLSGYIAEVMLVDGISDANHIQRLESYLAIKYGITLNAGVALGSVGGNNSYDYLAADGTTIWPADGTYLYDIAGIGKDRFFDNGANRLRYNLHQRIATSVNAEARVTISTNTDFSMDNLDDTRTPIDARHFDPIEYNYLVWGNDHQSMNVTNLNNPPGVDERIQRRWKIIESRSVTANPIANVSVRVDLTGSDILPTDACEIFLMIDEDGNGDFTDGTITYIEASSIVADNAFFDNVNFSGTDVFTVAHIADVEPPTASNPAPLAVCDAVPAPDPNVVTDENDNCAVDTVVHVSDVSDGNSNPETITRTYRITDTSSNFIDVVNVITLYTTPFAGNDNTAQICEGNVTPLNLNTSLGGIPNPGGTWNDDDVSGVDLSDPSNVDFSSLVAGSYHFTYTVPATAPCTDATATVRIEIIDQPDAGNDNTIQVCEGDPTIYDLNAHLLGSPDIGGTWRDLDDALGNGVGSIVGDPANMDFSGLGPATYRFSYTVTGTPPCPDDMATVTVVIIEQPFAGNDNTIQVCQGDATPLSLSASLAGIPDPGGSWNDDDASGVDLSDPANVDFSSIVAGSYHFTYTVTATAPCIDDTATVTIEIIASPTADAGSNEEICQGDNHDLLTSTTPPAAAAFSSLFWTTAGDGVFNDSTLLQPIYTPGATDIANGSVVLTLTANGNGPCTFVLDNMTLTITPTPTADAGSDEEICQGDNHDLSTSSTSPTASDFSSLSWTTAGDGIFDDSTLLQPIYTPGATDIANGSVVLTLTTNGNGPCTSVLDNMTLTITHTPTAADAGPDIQQCDNSNFTMAANTPTVGTGTWTQTAGPPLAIDDPSSPTTDVSGLPAGASATLRWTIANGTCPDSFDEVTLTNELQPSISVDVFSDPTTCGGSDGSIDLIFNNVPAGLHTIVHDSGSFPNVSVSAGGLATVNGLPAGNYNNLRITVNGCTSTDDPDVTLTAPGAPDIDPIADVTACDSHLLPAITGTSLTGSEAYYDLPGGGSGGGTLYNAGDAITVSGTYYAYDQNGTCADEESFNVTIDALPTANAGMGGDVCDIANPFATTAVAAIGAGTWTNQTPLVGSATFADPNNEATDITVDAYGTYTFRWTDTNGTCANFDEISVTFHQDPSAADAGPDTQQCDNGNFTMAANTPAMGTGTWTQTAGPPLAIDDPSSPTTDVSGLPTGASATLRWTIANGTCPDSIDEITLTNDILPTANAGMGGDICDIANPFATTAVAAIGTGTWTNQTPLVGNATFADPTDETTNVTVDAYGTYTFRWTDTNGTCADFDESTVTFHQDPSAADAGPDTQQCDNGNFTMAANAPIVGTGTWTQTAGPPLAIDDPSSPTTDVSGLPTGASATLRWTIANGTCPDSIDEVTLTNNPQPSISVDVFSDPTTCGGSDGSIDLIFNNVPAGLHTIVHDSGSFPNVSVSAGGLATVNGLPAGNYDNLRITINGCTSTDDPDVTLTAPGAPDIDPIADRNACDQFNMATISVTGTDLVSPTFYDQTGGASGGGNIIPAIAILNTTITVFIWDENGTCNDEESFLVTINNTPLADAPADVEACDSYQLPALANGNYFDAPNGGGNALNAGDFITATATIYVFSPGTGSCPDVENSFVVTINNTPLADAPADVEACDSYQLPALANGNYFDAPNGGGNALNAGDFITATATIYVFSPGTGSCPDVENSFVVTINNTPLADAPADVEACDSYQLPALANGNYFDAPNGGGNALNAGDFITATATIYVFSPGTGSCPDVENSFVVTINNTPLADAPADVEACDSYQLPALANGNYFDAPNGGGNALNAGDFITATATIYVFSPGTGSCPDVENSFVVTINNTPLADAPADVEACDSYQLPALANGNYFDAPNGGGNALNAGDFITATATIYVFSPGTGSCPDVENSFVVTINNTPLADAPADVEACDSYQLPALANGNYFDAPNGGGNALNAGDFITATATIYVFSPGTGSCPDVENSFVVTINNTPLADAPADVEACDSYQLPALANGNYFDAPNGGGNALNAGDFITATATIYVFSPGTGSCPDVENSFVVTINNTPLADAPADVEACDSYQLPALANGNYFDAPNGGGNALNAGDFITATATIYVFSPGTGSCPDVENSFVVTINNTPLADAPADVEACDSYQLPALANGNYFDAPNGGGNALNAGDFITATATIYVFSPGTGSCPDVENSFVVTINNTPLADAPADVEACDSYQLPALANGNYFDAPNGGGNALNAGDFITATATIYVFSPGTGSCPDVENSFVVTINNTPLADAPADVEACDSYQLPALANGNYFDAPNGGGNALNAGDFITATATIYVFSPGTGSCPDVENSFVVTINNTPLADAPADVEACDSYQLPALANGNYFDAPNGGGNALNAGDFITATATIYVFSPGTGSCPDVENSFVVTINNTPLADAPADVEACDSYQLPALANGNYFDAPNGGGNALNAGDFITATATIYVFSPGTGSCPDVENSFVVTINNTPLADAPADVEACDSYQLPALANGNYFDAPNGGGNALNAGDFITATATIYVFSPGTGSCPDVENSFVVTINNTPLADAPADVEACDSYQLPALANGNYFDAPNGGGNALNAGDFITATATIYVFSPGTGSCPDVENSFVVTINNTPLADAPADVEACDSYQLPALANGNYFDAPNGGGNALNAGDFITATATIYVFSPGTGSCPDVENSFVVTINNTPLADAPADVEACDSYQLPALANGNYFDAPNGGGNALNAGDFITATATIYVFSPGTGSCPDVENSFVVTINNTPLADAPADVEACDSYQLPALANGNYFDAPNGGGNALNAGDFITATATIYVFSPGTGSCPDVENSFVVTINNTPLADAPADVEACDSYQLPALANGNYFDAPNGGGNALNAGDFITATATIYVFSPGTGSCPDVENSFVVTINNTPLADAPADVEACDSYQLPALANGNYFDAPNGGGNALNAGDFITATATIYVFSPGTGSCPDVENSFVVTINNTPLADAPADVEACDSYQLPALANGNYFDAPNGGGNALNAGDFITATATIYVFSPGTGSCPDVENSFVVTISGGFDITTDVQNEACWESLDGTVTVTVDSIDFPLSVQLNSMQPMVFPTNSFVVDGLSPGNYTITVIDNSGCSSETVFEILPGGPNLAATIEADYSCDSGLPTNSIEVSLLDPSTGSDVLYALDSTNPSDFVISADFQNISPGDHTLSILHRNGCLLEIPFSIEDIAPLGLSLENTNVNEITATVNGGFPPYTYYFDSNGGSSQNTYTITRSGTFLVTIIDSRGCETSATITMNLVDITIPNFFTPNNDGQNDFWKPRNMELFADVETFIFDRYGRKIKIMGQFDNGWDGQYESKPLPSGDYWYIIKLNDGSGREFVGHFTLYR